MIAPLRVLILEDNTEDAELMLDELRQAGFEPEYKRVQTEAEYSESLNPDLDVILADYSLPQFDASQALGLLNKTGLGIPLIVLSGSISEEVAVECIKQGASDYLLKDRMTRLGQAVTQAMARQKDRDERREAEVSLRQSERYYRSLLHNMHEDILVIDHNHQITDVNNTFLTTTGHRRSDFIGRPCYEVSHGHDVPCEQRGVDCMLDEVFETGESRNCLHEHTRVNGSKISVDILLSPLRDEAGTVTHVIVAARDVTDVVKIQHALRESEEKYRELVENLDNIIYVVDEDEALIYVSPVVESLLGYAPSELLGRPFSDFIHRPDLPQCIEGFERVLAGQSKTGEYRIRTKSGSFRWMHSSNRPTLKNDCVIGAHGVLTDITDHKQAEDQMFQLNQLRESIIDNANVWLNVLDKSANIIIWNKAAERISGYSRQQVLGHDKVWEWLYPDETYRKGIFETAKRVIKGGITCVDDETIIRCRDGQTKIIAWNDRSLLSRDGNPIGSTAIGRDVTEQKHAAENLKKALEGTIQAVGMTTETRDPYTASHQQRVTELACAIASEMALSDEQIEGIRVAGLMHDIGKMAVPAEILSKPTQLSETEYNLIRCHPQTAYDILKAIEFPWPIAQIVLQHHERMNGSGYPRGLGEDKIMLEARILAVADVVEAMSSHRPYRPACGEEKALKEISQNKGKLYDTEVADACLRLFAENRFQFDEQSALPATGTMTRTSVSAAPTASVKNPAASCGALRDKKPSL